MKIIIVGGSKDWGLPGIFKRAFSGLGHDVEIFDSWSLYRNNFLAKNKLTHRLLWRFLAGSVQKKLILRVGKSSPDLILVFKGWLLKPSTLKKIKSGFPKTKIFCFNGDSPFNTWHHGNSNGWIRKSIPVYDCFFIWGKFLIDPLYEAGAKRVEYLPFGYDEELHRPVDVSNEEREKYGSDVSFIGAWDEEREKYLSQLLDYDLKIWGNNWEKAPNILQKKWQRTAVIGPDFSKVCNASKISLNFIRKQNGSANNMKTFEIPACAGFMISSRTPEQEKFFAEGKEADYFGDVKELREKIDYYLNHPREREKVAENGYRKLKKSGYSYKTRAEKIIEVYNRT